MLGKALWTGLYAGLKPGLVVARPRGRSNTVEPAGGSLPAPTSPEPNARPAGGPSPWLVLGAAFVVGVLAAKAIDWRGDAHPRS